MKTEILNKLLKEKIIYCKKRQIIYSKYNQIENN